MEQEFTLKYFGKLSLFEQANMTAESRKWWIQRLKRAKEEENKSSNSQTAGGPPKAHVSKPSLPTMPRR